MVGIGRRSSTLVAWCAPLGLLGAVLAAAAIVLARPLSLLGALLFALAIVPVGWVLASALWPARAERRCPACGREALERLDARATHGLSCRDCGWRDESASAWLLAEEEGGLEEIMLSQRTQASRETCPGSSRSGPGASRRTSGLSSSP
jgi:hypothetical protein